MLLVAAELAQSDPQLGAETSQPGAELPSGAGAHHAVATQQLVLVQQQRHHLQQQAPAPALAVVGNSSRAGAAWAEVSSSRREVQHQQGEALGVLQLHPWGAAQSVGPDRLLLQAGLLGQCRVPCWWAGV